MGGERPAGEGKERAAPPASRVTAGQLYRLIAPRRRWWRWGAAVLGSWGAAGLWLALADPAWRDAWRRLEFPVGFGEALSPRSLLLWAGLAGAGLGPMALYADCRAGRLQPLVLTGIDRLALLRAYHRAAFTVVVLLLTVSAPANLLGWLADVSDPVCAVAGAAANTLSHLATGCLAAALGLTLCTALGSRPWGMLLALLASWLLTVAGTYLLSRLAVTALDGVGWFKPQAVWIQSVPEFLLVISGEARLPIITVHWVVGGLSLLGWALLSELVLRLAARRLDRLVSD